jgi:adenylosuccinate synthase
MIHAVIGANFGDCGKGLIVDYLANHLTLVVRFNGGAQAGHTVVTPEGRRHEFHHVGAGTFRGATTLLSRFFIVNPLLYAREHAALGKIRPPFVDRHCRVTTPLDMLVNVAVEAQRGDRRHGSCGVGVNETVTRCEQEADRLTVGQLTRASWSDVLDRMYVHHVRRAAVLGVPHVPFSEAQNLFIRWRQDVRCLLTSSLLVDDASLLGDYDGPVVFEGAQGLRLDEQAPGFPHVTRSRTGLTNVLALLQNAGRELEPLDVTYVTRCYLTRHGAGPLAGELPGHPWGWTGPETNVANEHQGTLRYAPLYTGELAAAIRRDLQAVTVPTPWRAGLAVTCLDQAPGNPWARASAIAAAVGLPLRYRAAGPTRADVVEDGIGTPGRPVGAFPADVTTATPTRRPDAS